MAATVASTTYHTSTMATSLGSTIMTSASAVAPAPATAGHVVDSKTGQSAPLSIRIPRQDTTPCGRLVLGRTLQSGAHGTVCMATSLRDGRQVAVKVAHSDLESIRRLAQEARILASLPAHRHIVATYPTALPASQSRTSRAIYLPMQLCDTDLLELLLTERLEARTLLTFVRQLTAAVHHCHVNSVYHLDIKPENVLVDLHRGEIKLADFGMAKRLEGEDAKQLTDQHGSASYAAPEVWNPDAAGREPAPVDAAAADVWSLGAVLFTMVMRRRCWTDVSLADKDFRHYATTGDFLLYGAEADKLDGDMMAMLKSMLHFEPSERPSLEEVAHWIDTRLAAVALTTAAGVGSGAGNTQAGTHVVTVASPDCGGVPHFASSPMSMSCGSVTPTALDSEGEDEAMDRA